MKLFLDTASLEFINHWKNTGLIDGVTTNPTHLSKEGSNPREVVLAICDALPNGEISVEITEKEPEAVYNQAKKIANLSSNIIVKVPCHKKYYGIIHRLVQEGVLLNITLVFTLMQAVAMAKLGVRYVSPFIGRLDDNGEDGLGLIYDMRQVFDRYGFKTGILSASIRSIAHVQGALMAGTDAITIPMNLFPTLFDHPSTDRGMELFDADWAKVGGTTFP